MRSPAFGGGDVAQGGGAEGAGEFVDGVLQGGAMALYAEDYEEMAAA